MVVCSEGDHFPYLSVRLKNSYIGRLAVSQRVNLDDYQRRGSDLNMELITRTMRCGMSVFPCRADTEPIWLDWASISEARESSKTAQPQSRSGWARQGVRGKGRLRFPSSEKPCPTLSHCLARLDSGTSWRLSKHLSQAFMSRQVVRMRDTAVDRSLHFSHTNSFLRIGETYPHAQWSVLAWKLISNNGQQPLRRVYRTIDVSVYVVL